MPPLKLKALRAASVLLLASTGISCRTPEQYAGYAKAGTAYAAAMNTLLVATSQLSVDKHSTITAEDTAMARVLGQSRLHTQLLQH